MPARTASAMRSSEGRSSEGRSSEGMGGLAKGLAIIEALAMQGVLSVSDAARSSNITRAAARRCLITLTELGYVEHSGREFRPTPRLRRLGGASTPRDRIARLAEPLLKARARRSGRVGIAGRTRRRQTAVHRACRSRTYPFHRRSRRRAFAGLLFRDGPRPAQPVRGFRDRAAHRPQAVSRRERRTPSPNPRRCWRKSRRCGSAVMRSATRSSSSACARSRCP